MANITLNSYLHQIYLAWEDNNGDRVAQLLSLNDPHVLSSRLLTGDYQNIVRDTLLSPLAEMVAFHLKVLKFTNERNFSQALNVQCQLGQFFCKVLQSQKDENWGIDVMEAVCQDLRRISLTTNSEDTVSRNTEENAPTGMEKAADVIMALFRVCASDTRTQEQETKRWGMLILVNHLFKIYFRINRLHLCKPLIRAIEALTFNDRFPREQLVTYKYYVGRKAMFDSEFKEAAECLTYAFCNASTAKSLENRRKILTYLIPVKMFLGWLPTEEALRKYDLLEFLDVANALKDGNVKRFRDSLLRSEGKFIKAGVYLILEKLHTAVYRNLFKKVCLLYGNHQVPIKVLESTLRWSGYDAIDLDETHCIVANLIFDGQIRGYISHQHQVLVVAKQNPFPKMSTMEQS